MDQLTHCDDALDQRILELEEELKALKLSMPQPPLSQMIRDMFECNMIPMARASIDGHYLDVNQAYADLTGYTREELLSGDIGFMDLTAPEFQNLTRAAMQEIQDTGRANVYEKEYVRKDGTRIAVSVACTSRDERARDVIGFALNLSEIKAAELHAKQTEAQFRMLVDSMPQIVFISDADANVQYLNSRFSADTGLDKSEGMNQSWAQLIHPDDVPELMDNWAHVAANNADFEMRLRHRYLDGSYHWSLIRSVPMEDCEGMHGRYIGTASNIDEQKRVENELREREQRFRTLAEGIPQIVWTATANGTIDFFNARWSEYTGLTAAQSLEGAWKLLVHPADLPEYEQNWAEALSTGATYEHEFRLKRAVGLSQNVESPYLWHLCRAVALRSSSGRIIKWFGTWTEIHEQKGTK